MSERELSLDESYRISRAIWWGTRKLMRVTPKIGSYPIAPSAWACRVRWESRKARAARVRLYYISSLRRKRSEE